MTGIGDDFTDITPPEIKGDILPTAAQLQNGPSITPLQRLFLYSSTEWETFICEWASTCLKSEYQKIERFTGPNDKGIDVAGFTDSKLLFGVWDNYQCKHYSKPLFPINAWPEIGKIIWHSYSGSYKPPRHYYFVAPREIGTTLNQLLASPKQLKSELINAWDKYCRDHITAKKSISVDGAFAEYVANFDFSIFKFKPIKEILDQHKSTIYFIPRFGGGIPPRPKATTPPDQIDVQESNYVSQLLNAYADYTKASINDVTALKNWTKLEQHFKRQREAFYHAESLRVFVRDKIEPGTFESLQEEVFQGVADMCDATHPDGYACVVAVTQAARNLSIDAHPLAPSTFGQDKHGICHQLANEDRLKWTK